MHYIFISNVPLNETLQVPQQAPTGIAARLQGLFSHISQISYKNFPK
jgi:hypothetical protein